MGLYKQGTMLVVPLTLLLLAGMLAGGQGYTGKDRDSATRWLFKRLGEEPELLQPLQAMVEQRLGRSLPDIEPTEDTSALCTGCKYAVSAIKSAVYLLDYDDLRPFVIPMCKSFLKNDGGNLICEPLLDNYGPHVSYIFKQTNKRGPLKKSALQVCEFLTHCKIKVDDPRLKTTAAPPTAAPTTAAPPTAAPTTAAPPTAAPTTAAPTTAAPTTAAPTTAAPTTAAPTTAAPTTEPKVEEFLKSEWHPAADVIRGIMTSQEVKMEGRRHVHARKRRHAQRKENALKIVQLADFHIDEKFTEGAAEQCEYIVCCREDFPGNGTAGHWGGYKCNVPPRTIELFLNFTATHLQPEFLIYSGDNPPHTAWEETYASQIKVTQLAAGLVEKNIFDREALKTYPAIGNHETNPTNLYTMDKKVHLDNMTVFNQKWGEAWTKSAGFEAEQIETIKKAGYYTMLVKQGLRIVCLNSNYGYMDNWYNLIHWIQLDYIEMMEWFDKTLQSAMEAKEKVIMVSHHDIGVNIIEFDKKFTDILIKYQDIIVFHPVGHTHRDEYRLYFGDDTTKPAGMLHVSMTMGSWPNVNPGFRLFYLDRDDYTVLDYDQYYLNLETATADAEPVKLYTFTEEYGLPDASADSHFKLWNKLRRDPELMARYWDTKRLRTGADGPCDEDCVIAELCLQVSQTKKHFLTCEQYYRDEIIIEPPSTEAPTSTPPTTTTPSSGSGVRELVSNPLVVCLLLGVAAAMSKPKLG